MGGVYFSMKMTALYEKSEKKKEKNQKPIQENVQVLEEKKSLTFIQPIEQNQF